MLVLQETTVWNAGYEVPQHIYFTDNSKSHMYAYINCATNEGTIFKAPIPISTKGRKFELIKEFELELSGIPVKGSRGDMYYVTKRNGEPVCSCSGFKFRGFCRHIELVTDQLQSL